MEGGESAGLQRWWGRTRTRPSGRGVARFLLMGPSRTDSVLGIVTGLSWAELSHYSEVVLCSLTRSWAASQGLNVLCCPPLQQTAEQPSSPEDAPGRGTPAWCSRERGMCQDRQARPKREAFSEHVGARGAAHRQACTHTWAHSETDTCHSREYTSSLMCIFNRETSTTTQPAPHPTLAHSLTPNAHAYIHTPTHRHIWATWTHTDLHMYTSSPPSGSLD